MIDDFSRLYRENINSVYAYLSIYCNDEEDKKDIIQETFLAAWRARDSFENHSKISTWIIGIARNKLNDHFRSVYRIRDIYDKETPTSGFEEQKINDEIELRDLLLKLGKPDRELLFLVFNRGMNYSEVSILLNIPEGTVKSRMSRIRNYLRNKINVEAEKEKTI